MRAHWSSHPLIHPERLPSCELRTIVSDCQALSIRHLQQRCDLYVWDRVWARLAGSEVRSPFFSPCSVEQTNNSLVLCRCLTHSLLPWIHSAAARAKRHVTSMIRTLLKLVLDQVLQATSTLWKDQFLSKRCPEPIFCVCVLHTCSHRLNPCPLWRVFFFSEAWLWSSIGSGSALLGGVHVPPSDRAAGEELVDLCDGLWWRVTCDVHNVEWFQWQV